MQQNNNQFSLCRSPVCATGIYVRSYAQIKINERARKMDHTLWWQIFDNIQYFFKDMTEGLQKGERKNEMYKTMNKIEKWKKKQINLNLNKYKIMQMGIMGIKIVFITPKTIWVLAPQKLQLITH